MDNNVISKPVQTQPVEYQHIQATPINQVSSSQLYSNQTFNLYQHQSPPLMASPMAGGVPYHPPYNPYPNYHNPYGYAPNYQHQAYYGQVPGYTPSPPQFGYPAPPAGYYQNHGYQNPYANVAANLNSIALTPEVRKEEERNPPKDKKGGSMKENVSIELIRLQEEIRLLT